MNRYINADELQRQLSNKKLPYGMNIKSADGYKSAILAVKSMVHQEAEYRSVDLDEFTKKIALEFAQHIESYCNTFCSKEEQAWVDTMCDCILSEYFGIKVPTK